MSWQLRLTERQSLERDPLLARCLDLEAVNLEGLEPAMVNSRLLEVIAAVQTTGIGLRLELAAGQRALDSLEATHLLHPTPTWNCCGAYCWWQRCAHFPAGNTSRPIALRVSNGSLYWRNPRWPMASWFPTTTGSTPQRHSRKTCPGWTAPLWLWPKA